MKSILLSPGRDSEERMRVALVGCTGAELFERRETILSWLSQPAALRSYVLPDCADDILPDAPDLILADRRGAAADLDAWISRSRDAYGARAPIVVIDESPDADDILLAMRAGASDFVDATDSDDDFRAAIERASVLRAGAVERRVAEAQIAVAEAERRFARIVEARVHARIARQLRQPLAATVAFAREASEGLGDTALVSQRLDLVLQSSRRSLAVVEGVLDYLQLSEDRSRDPSTAGDLQVEPIRLETLADRLRHEHAKHARARDLDFDVSVTTRPGTGSVDIAVRGLLRVLGHLIDNAIRFTERGRVSVRLGVEVGAEGANDAASLLVCRIDDSGVGMDPDTLATACEPFGVSSAERERHFEGAGLGLATSLRLLGLIGGDLAIDSKPGLGTTCVVRVPVGGAQLVGN